MASVQTQQVNLAGVVAKHWKDVAPTKLYSSFRIRVLDSREIAVDAGQGYEMGRPSTLSFRTGVTPGGIEVFVGGRCGAGRVGLMCYFDYYF